MRLYSAPPVLDALQVHESLLVAKVHLDPDAEEGNPGAGPRQGTGIPPYERVKGLAGIDRIGKVAARLGEDLTAYLNLACTSGQDGDVGTGIEPEAEGVGTSDAVAQGHRQFEVPELGVEHRLDTAPRRPRQVGPLVGEGQLGIEGDSLAQRAVNMDAEGDSHPRRRLSGVAAAEPRQRRTGEDREPRMVLLGRKRGCSQHHQQNRTNDRTLHWPGPFE